MAGSLFLDGYKRPKKDKKKDEKKTEVKKPQSSSASRVNERASNSTFMGGGAAVQNVRKNSTAPTKPRSANNQQTSTTTQQGQTGTGRQTTTTRHTPTSREMINQRQTDTGTGSKTTSNRRTPTAKEMLQQRQNEENERRRNRDANLNLKQTQAPASRRRAEPTQNATDRRKIAQAMKSGDYDRASELRGPAKSGSLRAKYEQWDKDISDTITHTIKQGLAADARVANLGMKGITQKDDFLYTTEEQRKQADKKTEERDKRLARIIENETKAIEDAQKQHGYLGKQALSAVSSTTGMGMDIAAGAIIPGSSLFHMWARSTGTSLGEVNKKADNLRKKLKATGQYSDEELDEMFKNVDAYDMANAAASGGIEVLSELLFPGVGAARKVIGGKGMSIAERAGAKLFNRVGEKASAGLLRNVLKGTGEEVLEEEVGGPLQALTSNLIYGNRFQRYNEDAVKRSLTDQSNTLRSQIRSDDDARAAAARLNSQSFMDDSIQAYMESGISKKEATELAELSREYLSASLTGDVDAMKKYQDEMVSKLAGEDNSLKAKFGLQDAIDAAVSTSMMTLATGAPGAFSTMQVGNAYKDSVGLDAVKQQAEIILNWGEEKDRSRAQAIMDHIDNGGDLSGTQVYEIVQQAAEVAAESKESEQTKNRLVQTEMRKRDLRINPFNPDGTLAPQTSRRYEQIVNDTMGRYAALSQIGEGFDFDASEVELGADIGAAFKTGVISSEQINELARGSAATKTVFEDVTGIDIKQFDSNTEMRDALMAEAAQNMVNSARLEQAAWNDEERGHMADYLSKGVGGTGDVAIQNALAAVDPRDRGKFILTGEASRRVYEYARNTDDSWNDVKHRFSEMFEGADSAALKSVFNAAKEDKAIAETAYYGKVVKSGEELKRSSVANADTAVVAGKYTDNRSNKEGDKSLAEESLLKSFVKAFGINVEVVDDLASPVMDAEGNPVLDIEGNPVYRQDNGLFDPNTNTLVVNAHPDVTRTITQTATHELTHFIAVHAPDEYVKLSRYIMDAWYKQDAEGFKREIGAIQRLYKQQKNQDLSTEQALEELIANGTADFNWGDEDFIAEVTAKEPTLASKIIDAIKEVLRKIRSILASGDVLDAASREALYDKAVEFDTVRSLWVKAAQTARQAEAQQAVDEWQDRANISSDTRHSVSDDGLVIRDGNARWTDDRIDRLIRENGASNPDYSQAYAVLMNPRDYLKLTLSDDMLDRWNEGSNAPEHPEVYSLNEDELRDEYQTPYLTIYSNDGTEVQGHEGRHRMRALLEAGVQSVPVVIRDTDTKYSKVPTESMTLTAQDFGYDPVNNGAAVTITDLVPIKESNRDELIQKFGGDAQVRFSISDSTNANNYAEKQLLEDADNTVLDLAESDLSVRYSFGPEGTFYEKGFHSSSGTNVTGSDVKKSKGNPLLKSGKEILAQTMKKNINAELKKQGINTRSKEAKAIVDARIEAVMNFMDAMNGFMEETGLQYTFIGMQDVYNAKISVRKTSKGIQAITMSAMVKNGEYPINFDFTTICKKRQAFNAIIEKLTDESAEGVDISLSPKELGEINNALRKEGLETACLGCFVEARRYNMQNYTNKVCELWNKCVDEYAASIGVDPADIEDFNFSNGENTTEEKFQDAADTFFAYENTAASKKNPEDRFRHIIRSSQKTYMKHLHPADLITSNGIQHIKDMSTKSKDFFGMLKSAYGVAAPKETIKYVPYNSEVALLPANKGKDKDGNTQTMLDYLKSIGGIRMQSFSDYLVANTFDYMQMVADMAARGFPAHAYTKEIAFARVFGMTGIKINLSIMYDVQNLNYWRGIFKDASDERLREIAAKYAGLQYFENADDIPEEFKDYDEDGNLILDHGSIMQIDEDGIKGYLTYLVGDENRSQRYWEEVYRQVLEETGDEAQAEEQANECRKWIQSINFKEAKELQRKKGYGTNCGMIGVGLSNANILLMLNDDNMPYIIPYHASGLPDVIKQHTGLNFATNYEDTQNTRIFVSFTKDGEELGYDYVRDLKDELGSWQKAWDKVSEEIRNGDIVANGRTPKAATETEPAEVNKDGNPYVLHGTADFDFYAKIANGATPQEAAEMYLEYCDDYGLLPVFPQFAGHPNYYKLLVDYSVTDLSNKKATSPQGAVKNIYPGSNGTIANIDEGSTDYEGIKSILKDEFEKLNAKNKHRDEVVDKIVEEWKRKDIRHSIAADLDGPYMDAVNSGNMDEAQRLVDEAAGIAGMRVAHRYHGTMNAGFTVFDKAYAKVGGNSGAGFYFSTEEDDSINHYQDVEGADNYFKWSSLADSLWEEGYYGDLEIIDHDHAVEIAKELMNQNPGTFDVYLNYKKPYIRNGRSSTNIYNSLYDDFDESLIDRDDYDTEDEYEDALLEERSNEIYRQIATAVHDAMIDIRDFYDVIDSPTEYDIYNAIADHAFSYEEITWDSILRAVENAGYAELIRDDWTESGYGATEFTRAIIENFGFDAIEDKEVSSKFGQLSREMMTDTEHIIVFRPEQIKLSDPVTYAEDGSVIPLSERFDPTNNDIRYSLPTQDSDGNILTDGQMEYFKNSQARDSQGRLVPVFHTTNRGGFTVFDPSYSDDKRSLFFASNWYVSQTYGREANNQIDLNRPSTFKTMEEYARYAAENYAEWDSNKTWEENMGFELYNLRKQSTPITDKDVIQKWKNGEFKAIDGYVALLERPSRYGKWVNVDADTIDELLDALNNVEYRKSRAQSGYYSCYLNLENPLIVDAHGANWNKIPYGQPTWNPTREKTLKKMESEAAFIIDHIESEWEDFDDDFDDGAFRGLSLEITGKRRKEDGTFEDWNVSEHFTVNEDELAEYDDYASAILTYKFARYLTEELGWSYDYYEEIADHSNDANGDIDFTPSFDNQEKAPDYITSDGYKMDYAEIFDEISEEDGYIFEPYEGLDVGTYKTRELAQMAEAEGYDGVIIRNCRDIGGVSYLAKGSNPISDIYIAFSSNQVKDINNENPTENPDIRYSITDDDEAMSHMAHDYAYDNSYETLAHYEEMIAADEADETVYQKAKNYIAKDVDEFYAGLTRYADGMRFDDPVLEEGRTRMARSKQDFFNSNKAKWNQNWLTDGEVLDIKSVEKAVRDLVTGTMLNSNTNRKYSQETVKKTLMDMRLAYFYAKQGRTDIADALLWHSAHRMIDGVEFYREDGNFETYKRLRDYFKDAKLQLGEDYWNDVDYAAFRKMNFGRLNLVRGKTNLDKILDDLYHENSDGSIEGIAVEWFNPEAFEKNNYKIDSVPDILLQIADVLDTVEPYAEAYSSEYCAEWATDIASDLLDIMQSGKELQSTADKYKKRYDEKAKAMKARHAEAMLKVRRQRDEGIRKERVKFKEYVEKKKEKQAHNKYFDSIQKSHKKLTDRLLSNTADSNIPQQYKKELAKLLAAFDLQTVGSKKVEARRGVQGQKTIKMAAIKTALNNIESRSGEFHVSDAITDIIDELLGKDMGNGNNRGIEGMTIDELNSSELARIDKLLKALVHEFNTYKTVKIQAKRQQVEDIGKAQVNSSLEHAQIFGQRKDYQNITGVLDKIVNMGEMTPAYMFRMLDPNNEGIGLMWKEIRRSFDRYVRNQNQLNDWMDEIIGEYHQKGILWNKYGSGELSNWRSTNYQQTFVLNNGTVTLTPAQMMSLYCLSKRNQAYGHMVGAGIVVAPVSFQAKIMSDVKKKADMSLPVILTDADIKHIVSKLTPDQIKVADKLQELMATKMAAWGNEASMNVLGIELFGEPDYFPIKSDKAALEKDLDADQFANAIRSFGFTKAVQPGARNAIMIDDIFDVVAEHCNNMNLYNSYSEAMNDFMKVYNYRDFREDGREYTVQQAIAHAYSRKATTYIMQFMKDLNGNVSGRSDAIENAYNTALGNAKKAAVFANLRVAAQQPTAIVRAFAEIDPKYIKGIRVGQGDMKEMMEHCPIALWKSWGYYDINMGKSIEDIMMNNGKWLEDKATDLYGALDNVTWTAIWQMVKAETRDKHPELKEGTDEFFEHCNERMSEIVDFTQVVDSPMHRSHDMRSKNMITKLATSFMAEPTLTFNMVKDGMRRAYEEYEAGSTKKAAGILQRTFNVFIIQAGTVAAFAAAIDALRKKKPDKDDEDDRFLHLWWVNALENFKDNLKLWNNIYFVKDIASMFEGWDNNNLALQGWKNLATGWNQLTGNGYVKSSKAWYENMAYGLGYLTGIPAKTIMTGISNFTKMFGVTIPGADMITEELDALPDAFKKDDAEIKPESMAGKFISNVLSEDDKSVMDKVAEKMGYRRIAASSTDKSSSSTSESESSSSSMTESDLPDNLTDEQKKDILKAGEKRAKKAETEEEQEQLNYDKMLYDAMKAAAGLEGEEYNKKIYSSVAQGLKGYIADGDYTSIGMMRTVIEQAGGDVAYFDQRVMEETKSAYKKTLVYAGDMYSPEGLEARNNQKAMFRYMMNHGMTQEELSSEVLYHCELAKDMKVAYRVGDNDLIYEAMLPLVDAGITELDLERLYENRNRMDLTKYKQNGRFKDKLKSMGTFIWPTEGVITSHFGYRNAPTAGASSNHPAIDIGAPTGTPVVAADGGVVISAGANGGYGNSVGIKHDNGMITWYNHLSGWNVKVGDTVGQGQQIAQVGSTGISTGPHLDFKIVDKNGNPVDPEKYLNKR